MMMIFILRTGIDQILLIMSLKHTELDRISKRSYYKKSRILDSRKLLIR